MAPASLGWVGTDELATRIPTSGRLSLLPRVHDGYRFKQMYWGRDITRGIDRALHVRAVHNDVGTTLTADGAGGGVGDGGIPFRSVVLDFPDAGCWTIIATFGDASVSYTLVVEAGQAPLPALPRP